MTSGDSHSEDGIFPVVCGYLYVCSQMALWWTGGGWRGCCLLAPFGLWAGTSPHWYHRCSVDVLGCLNHTPQSPPVLRCAWTSIWDVSCQDASYSSAVKVGLMQNYVSRKVSFPKNLRYLLHLFLPVIYGCLAEFWCIWIHTLLTITVIIIQG